MAGSSAGELALIGDLALVLVSAGIVALVFHRLHLPPVLGYLVAGVLVGPHVLPITLVQDPENISLLAQLGVLFLLFSLGLHFHLRKLRRVGGLAFTAGTLEVSLMIGVGILTANLFGWRSIDALFLGAILAISSTTLIVKVLSDQGKLHAPSSEAIFGILLVEDVVAVLLIALLSSIALTGTITVAALAALVARIAIFVIAALVLGLVVVPRLVDHIAKLRVEEMLVLVVVGVAFLVSMIAVALELSLALGAFIAGAVVAESRASATVERRIAPLRDVFTAVFFVSTGILIDPSEVVRHLPAIGILSVVTIAGNVGAAALATFVAGYTPREAIRVGVGLAMIGEFSYVIAALGRDLGVTAPFLFTIAVSVSAVTAFVTPFLVRHSDRIVDGIERVAPTGLRDFTGMYTAWVARIRPTGSEAFSGRYDFGALLRVLIYSAVLAGWLFLVGALDDWVLLITSGSLVALAAAYAVGALVALPMALGILRGVRDLVDRLVAVVVPAQDIGTQRGSAAAAVLRNTLYAFVAVLVGVVGVAAGAAFLPPLPLVGAALTLVVAAGFFLRGSLKRLDKQLESAVDTVFRPDANTSSRDEMLHLIRERHPWDLHVESVLVPPNARAANRRIRDLGLPQRTGATIVTHERDGVQRGNPPPGTILLPGDMVGVLGERDQVEQARALLTTELDAAERPSATVKGGVDIEEVVVEEGSPAAGLTLAGSRIRETTGASVVGLRRDGVPILNPAPVLRMKAGDSVVLLGSASQLDAARRMFERA